MWLAAAVVSAFCQAEVQGTGTVDVELDYLPHVVQCENGGASAAALEAQAVAARSYLYYKLAREGSIGDGQGDQVYSCGRDPTEAHFAAAEATAGKILRYRDTQVAAFYVAGARDQPPPECRGSTDDPTDTERYVTYNEGLSGDGIEQTSLGWVDPSNDANRGCMSQNGADCLSDDGHDAGAILRFYYGEDIEVVTAEGACVPPVVDDGGGAGDDGDDGFISGCGCTVGARVRGKGASILLLVLAGLLSRRARHGGDSRHCRFEPPAAAASE